LRASPPKTRRKVAPPVLSARLNQRFTLQARADGSLTAGFDGYAVELGKFSAGASKRAQELRAGLPLNSFSPDGNAVDREIDQLVRRLAQRGLLEYRLARARSDEDIVVIEPQTADYWPQTPKLAATDSVALSRFAYLRRRGSDIVLESPRATALFRICDPKITIALAALSSPQKVSKLRRLEVFPASELLALLVDCQIVFKLAAVPDQGLRHSEGDEHLVVWDFHDLLFHVHSTQGRQANPLGGRYAYAEVFAPPPAVRSPWPGTAIDLQPLMAASSESMSPFARLLRARYSARDFDDQKPITLAELAIFLDGAARVQSKWTSPLDYGDGSFGPDIDYTTRPYPAAGSAYELELYLAVTHCEGLEAGFYHYDADRHALVPIDAQAKHLDAMIGEAAYAMDTRGPPQILITIAARFNRVAWKYSAIAYSLILRDVGVLLQTFYLAATDIGLAGCAVGTSNIDLFAKMTGMEFHVEGSVGQFALGRAAAEPPQSTTIDRGQ
jgi:SagB-type dehydrogenase family enzyme